MDCIKRLIGKCMDGLWFNKDEFVVHLIICAVTLLWIILVSAIMSLCWKYNLKWVEYGFYVLVFGTLMIFFRKLVFWCIVISVGGLAWVVVTAFVYINLNENVGLFIGAIPYCYTAWKMFLGKLVKSAIESLKLLNKSLEV